MQITIEVGVDFPRRMSKTMRLSNACPTYPIWGHKGPGWGFVKVNVYFALTLGQYSNVLSPTFTPQSDTLLKMKAREKKYSLYLNVHDDHGFKKVCKHVISN